MTRNLRHDKAGTFTADTLSPGDIVRIPARIFQPGAGGEVPAYLFRPHYDTAGNREKVVGFTVLQIATPAQADKIRPRPETFTLPRDGATGLPGAGERDYVAVLRPQIMSVQSNEFITRLGAFTGLMQDRLIDYFQDYGIDRKTEGYIRGSGLAWDLLVAKTPIRGMGRTEHERDATLKPRLKKPGVRHTKKGIEGAEEGKVIDLDLTDAQTHYGLDAAIVTALQQRADTLRAAVNLPEKELAKLLPNSEAPDISLDEAVKRGLIPDDQAWPFILTRPAKGFKKITTLKAAFDLAKNRPDDLNRYGGLAGTHFVKKMRTDILLAEKRVNAQTTKTPDADAIASLRTVWDKFKTDFVNDTGKARQIVRWTTQAGPGLKK